MATQIFVNLPVKDLNKSVDFFTKLGYSFNPQFTDEKATCMIISDTIYVMLLVEPFFKSFIKKDVADATQVSEALICLSADSREAVDDLVDKAIAAGATLPGDTIDQGFMYSRSYSDLDGHHWEVMYMDPAALTEEQPATENAAA
jgi:predicted lactoylglutathione lyase